MEEGSVRLEQTPDERAVKIDLLRQYARLSVLAFSEADGRPDEEGAAQRIIGRRLGVAAVLGRAAIVVADHGRLLVEQVVDAAAQREALGHVIAARQVEIVIGLDLRDHEVRRVGRAEADRVVGQLADILPAKLERSEEHTSELQSLMRISYAVFCLKKKQRINI